MLKILIYANQFIQIGAFPAPNDVFLKENFPPTRRKFPTG